MQVIPTVSATLVTTFQLVSTALTVTLYPAPAVCAVAVPILPLTVPGAAVSPGVSNCSRANPAGLTTTLADVAPVRPALLKSIVMVVATLCDRLVKASTPLTDVRVVAPCKAPLPAFRLAVTTVPLSLLRKLPNWSSIRIFGCWAKAAPAVPVAEGCV